MRKINTKKTKNDKGLRLGLWLGFVLMIMIFIWQREVNPTAADAPSERRHTLLLRAEQGGRRP